MTTNSGKQKRSDAVIDGLFVAGTIYAFFCAFVLLVSFLSSTGESFQYAYTREVAKNAFHLVSDQEYPLRYGKRVEGSSGHAEARGGLFSASAKVNIHAASSLSVDYSYGKNSYILELPMEKIRFVQEDGESSSIRLKLADQQFGEPLDEGQRTIRFWGVPYFYQPPKSLNETEWFKAYKEEGQLAPLVSEHLESAVITLSPEDYTKILGG